VRHPELQLRRQTQNPINFEVNYRSGIIRRCHASIASILHKSNPVAKLWATRQRKRKKGPKFGRAL
jgi:hypothetical protein